MDVIKTQQISTRAIEKVVVHPLVLLSIVDNYNRVAKDTRKRVVGVLLGSSFKGTVDVTNSYAGELLLFFQQQLQFSFPISISVSTITAISSIFIFCLQFHLKKMIRILPSGFSITITMNQCFQCLRESMVYIYNFCY